MDKMREEFEKWALEDGYNLYQYGMLYSDMLNAFQAGHQAATKEAESCREISRDLQREAEKYRDALNAIYQGSTYSDRFLMENVRAIAKQALQKD
jgi:hypothetical protein